MQVLANRSAHQSKFQLMLLIAVAMIFAFFFCFQISCVRAEPGNSFDKSAATNQSTPLSILDLDQQIGMLWAEIELLLETQSENLDIHAKIEQLEALRLKAGYESFESYSMKLLDHAVVSYHEEHEDRSAKFIHYALKLSPLSSRVLFRAAAFGNHYIPESSFSLVLSALKNLPYQPQNVMRLIDCVIYLLLLTVSLSAYIVLVLNFAFKIRDLYAALSRPLAPFLRGTVTPILLLIVLCGPPFLGPLSAIAIWGAMTAILLRNRWICFVSFVLVSLWSTIIPLRENIHSWLADPAVQVMLQSNVADFSPTPIERKLQEAKDPKIVSVRRAILQDYLRELPNDGPALYALGQRLRRENEVAVATQVFSDAERVLRSQPYTVAQMGLLQLLGGDIDRAQASFEKADRMGLDSGSFLFDYSKVLFEKVDTAASRSLINRANKSDAQRSHLLQVREDTPGISVEASLAEIALPLSYFFSSAFNFPFGSNLADFEVSTALCVGASTQELVIISLLLFGAFFLSGLKNRRAVPVSHNCFPNFTLPSVVVKAFWILPGAAFIRYEKPWAAWIVLSLLFVLFLPVCSWPAGLDDYRIFFGWKYAVSVWTVSCAAAFLQFYVLQRWKAV